MTEEIHQRKKRLGIFEQFLKQIAKKTLTELGLKPKTSGLL